MADLQFWFDPVCPFAWQTSRWVRQVQRLRGLDVEWRLISLRLLNDHLDYAAHFPPEYEHGHTAGLRMLRVALATRDQHGPAALDRLQSALGEAVFMVPLEPGSDAAADHRGALGTTPFVEEVLRTADLPTELARHLDAVDLDVRIRAETDEALALTGRDVGTPILRFAPDVDGPALFGPVVSRLPDDDRAVELWDAVTTLAAFPSFTELKRAMRELPALPALGVPVDAVGVVEEWAAGRRPDHVRPVD